MAEVVLAHVLPLEQGVHFVCAVGVQATATTLPLPHKAHGIHGVPAFLSLSQELRGHASQTPALPLVLFVYLPLGQRAHTVFVVLVQALARVWLAEHVVHVLQAAPLTKLPSGHIEQRTSDAVLQATATTCLRAAAHTPHV